jgi:putative sigma-54 modulation protein
MELTINGHHIEITERIHGYIEKKTDRLDRYMPDLMDVRVDLSEESFARNANERQVAQITIRDNRGTILRAEERSNDLFAAIDAVIDKLYSQISRYRGKKQRKWRNSESTEENLLGDPLPFDIEFDDEETKLVKQKRFTVRPMTTDEAIDQLELLGHDFYVFYNGDEDGINVVYRRRDQNYGLILPEFD